MLVVVVGLCNPLLDFLRKIVFRWTDKHQGITITNIASVLPIGYGTLKR